MTLQVSFTHCAPTRRGTFLIVVIDSRDSSIGRLLFKLDLLTNATACPELCSVWFIVFKVVVFVYLVEKKWKISLLDYEVSVNVYTAVKPYHDFTIFDVSLTMHVFFHCDNDSAYNLHSLGGAGGK